MEAARQAALEAHTAHVSAQTLRQCLSAWQAHNMQRQAVRAAAEALAQSRESAALRSILRDWRQVTSAERRMREGNVQSFRVASQRRCLSCALTHWQALQKSAQAARARADERHEALQAVTLGAAFQMWRLVSTSMAGSQQLSCQSVSRAFSMRKLRFLLRAWASFCRAAQAARQAAQDLANRVQLRSMQRAFSAWRAANASLQHQRSMLLSLCIELAHERQQSAAFTAWHGIARAKHSAVVEARSLEAQHACRTLRQAFAAWRIINAALAHQQRSAAEQMLTARGQRLQRGTFMSWRQHTCHMRAARDTAVIHGLARQKHRRMIQLARILRSWRQYARVCADMERAEASLSRQGLRPCTLNCSPAM